MRRKKLALLAQASKAKASRAQREVSSAILIQAFVRGERARARFDALVDAQLDALDTSERRAADPGMGRWVRVANARGFYFYRNLVTGVTQWAPPADEVVPGKRQWEMRQAEAGGAAFFYNPRTRKKKWMLNCTYDKIEAERPRSWRHAADTGQEQGGGGGGGGAGGNNQSEEQGWGEWLLSKLNDAAAGETQGGAFGAGAEPPSPPAAARKQRRATEDDDEAEEEEDDDEDGQEAAGATMAMATRDKKRRRRRQRAAGGDANDGNQAHRPVGDGLDRLRHPGGGGGDAVAPPVPPASSSSSFSTDALVAKTIGAGAGTGTGAGATPPDPGVPIGAAIVQAAGQAPALAAEWSAWLRKRVGDLGDTAGTVAETVQPVASQAGAVAVVAASQALSWASQALATTDKAVRTGLTSMVEEMEMSEALHATEAIPVHTPFGDAFCVQRRADGIWVVQLPFGVGYLNKATLTFGGGFRNVDMHAAQRRHAARRTAKRKAAAAKKARLRREAEERRVREEEMRRVKQRLERERLEAQQTLARRVAKEKGLPKAFY